jgi:prolipoprotein diacylglyceryltransferase
LPVWLFAYSYPQNVNTDGILIPKITDPHNRVLPQPVFPTPLYEIIICSILFTILWWKRKTIKTPLTMFGIYMSLNGLERLFIEKLRVNKFYNILGFQSTQAQFIAILLILGGMVLIMYSQLKLKHKES